MNKIEHRAPVDENARRILTSRYDVLDFIAVRDMTNEIHSRQNVEP